VESKVSSALPKSNRVAISDNLAVLFCPSSSGKTFGVTIDREDLERVQGAGPWSVSNFNKAQGTFRFYCHSTRKSEAGRTIYLHRFLLNAPAGVHVDHRFNRTLDNRKSEIRLATPSANQLNRSFSMLGRDRCVRQLKSGNFQAVKWSGKKRKSLGTFPTRDLARMAVRQYLIEQGANYAAGAI
jgi:hypothetical protein